MEDDCNKQADTQLYDVKKDPVRRNQLGEVEESV